MKLIADYFRNYVNFSGRTSRRDFWLTVLYLFLSNMAILIPYYIAFFKEFFAATKSGVNIQTDPLGFYSRLLSNPVILTLTIIIWLWNLVRFIPDLSLTTRRLRDAGVTPWWIAISFATAFGSLLVPIFAFLCLGCCIIMLILLCKPSKPETTTTENTQDNTTNNTQQS